MYNEVEHKTRYLYTDGDIDTVFSCLLLGERKLKPVKGDFEVPDDDFITSKPVYPVHNLQPLKPRMKQSLFNELANMDIGIIKERELTPPQKEKADKIEIMDDIDNGGYVRTNSFSKENVEKVRTTLAYNNKNKLFAIKSKEDSIIKVADNCKYMFDLL
jgi:hypothetical protein